MSNIQENRKSPASDPSGANSLSRLLSRAEAAVLIGMLMVVFSLYLVWQRLPVDPAKLRPIAGLLFRPMLSVYRTGSSLIIKWPLTLAALGSGLTLAWSPTATNRYLFLAVQGALAAMCLLMTLLYFAPLPGVWVSLGGCALLIYGAWDRYVHVAERSVTSEGKTDQKRE